MNGLIDRFRAIKSSFQSALQGITQQECGAEEEMSYVRRCLELLGHLRESPWYSRREPSIDGLYFGPVDSLGRMTGQGLYLSKNGYLLEGTFQSGTNNISNAIFANKDMTGQVSVHGGALHGNFDVTIKKQPECRITGRLNAGELADGEFRLEGQDLTFVGHLRDSKASAVGKLSDPERSYDGEWYQDLPHGHGVCKNQHEAGVPRYYKHGVLQPEGPDSTNTRRLETSIEELQHSVDRLQSGQLGRESSAQDQRDCKICMSVTADIVMIPCGHVAVCEACHLELIRRSADGAIECILCRAQSTTSQKIYT